MLLGPATFIIPAREFFILSDREARGQMGKKEHTSPYPIHDVLCSFAFKILHVES